MPKTKKVEESESSGSGSGSDSDSSGPKDRNPPAKKAKTEPASSSSKPSKPGGGGGGGSKSKDSQESSWTLDKNRQIRINEFKGKVYVDIREFYEDKGELKPGKRGISLNMAQWAKFKDYISDIDEALKNH